jgi:hypothetical protein
MLEFNESAILKRCWLNQLLFDFEDVCYSFDVHLRKPVFEISETGSSLGSWTPDTRILAISQQLIVNYPWYITQQVLKHEMAHQLCSEFFFSKKPGHGEDFRRACDLLGVLPEFRGHKSISPELLETLVVEHSASKESRKFLQRVEKLFALGSSANEHEAELAVKKANELIEKYHLGQLLDDQSSAFTVRIINQKRKRIFSYQKYICTILQDFFYVQVLLSAIYDPLDNESHRTIEIFGTRENVAIAEYCYFFVENQLKLLWKANRNQFGKKQRANRNSYFIGMVLGYHETLKKQRRMRQQKSNQTTAKLGELILAEDQRLQQFVAMRSPKISRRPSGVGKVYKDSYEKGKDAGRTIRFSEGISKSDSKIKLIR